MKIIDRLLEHMHIDPEDDFDDDYEDDYEDFIDDEEEEEKKESRWGSKNKQKESVEPKEKSRSIITPIRSGSSKRQGNMSVCVIKPEGFEDVKEITETLLSNRTVVLNVEGLDVETAQRILDFTSGSCFAIHGNLQKISNYIFIITPESVDLSGDFQDILDSFAGPSIQTDFRL